jgi:hypothetical protein
VKIVATVKNAGTSHEVAVGSAVKRCRLDVPAKASGTGSAVSGGEFLMLR